MATTEQKKLFINRIAPLAQKAYRQFGKPLPSICIAMAAVECNWGLAGSCKYNSYLGQKVGTGKTATKYWGGKYFNARTKEVTNQSTGQLKTIRDNFRAYDNAEQCIFNYYELLNTSLYKRVIAGSSYKDQMQQIKSCGYMTSITEVNTCLNIISQNNLTQYDDGSGEEKTNYIIGRNYTLQSNMYVRESPRGKKKPYSELSINAKKNAKRDSEGNGILNKGTIVTCKGIEYREKEIWIKIPSGYICAEGAKKYIM